MKERCKKEQIIPKNLPKLHEKYDKEILVNYSRQTERTFEFFLSMKNRFKSSTNRFLESECLSQLNLEKIIYLYSYH